MPRQNKVYGLHNRIDFGRKHNGRLIKDLIEEDPDYLLYCVDHLPFFSLTRDAEQLLDQRSDILDEWEDWDDDLGL